MTKLKLFILGIIFPILTLFANDVDLGIELYKSGNTTKAIQLLKKACDDGNANGCYTLGVLYMAAEDLTQDIPKATKLFKKL